MGGTRIHQPLRTWQTRRVSRTAGLLLGFAADRLLGDPRRFHPVAGFGQLAGRAEKILYADSRAAGTAYAGLLVGSAAAAGVVAGPDSDINIVAPSSAAQEYLCRPAILGAVVRLPRGLSLNMHSIMASLSCL